MSPRQQAIAEQVEIALTKIGLQRLYAIEDLLANAAALAELAKIENNSLRKKLDEAYATSIQYFANEIIEMDRFIVSRLDYLDDTCDDLPISHTNVNNATANLTNFVARDILTSEAYEKRVIILKRYIHTLKILFQKNDLHGFCGITAAFNLGSIAALKTCFIKLTDEETKLLDEYTKIVLNDQAWSSMSALIQTKSSMIPNLLGIRKKLGYIKECKSTHASHKEFLQESGKLKTSTRKTPHKQSKQFDYIDSLTAILAEQAKQSKKYDDLSDFQKILLPRAKEDKFKVVPSIMDESQLLDLADKHERDCIPGQIQLLSRELDSILNYFEISKNVTPNDEHDVAIKQIYQKIIEKCRSSSPLTYNEKITFVAELLTQDILFKQQNFVKKIVGKDPVCVTKLRLIKTLLEKLNTLSSKIDRIKRRESVSSSTSGSFLNARPSMRMKVGLKNTGTDNSSNHGSGISSRSSFGAADDCSDHSGNNRRRSGLIPPSESSSEVSESRKERRKSVSLQLYVALNPSKEVEPPSAVTTMSSATILTSLNAAKENPQPIAAVQPAKVEAPTITPAEPTKDKKDVKKLEKIASVMQLPQSPEKESSRSSNGSAGTLRNRKTERSNSDRHLPHTSKEERKKPNRDTSLRDVTRFIGKSFSRDNTTSARTSKDTGYSTLRK